MTTRHDTAGQQGIDVDTALDAAAQGTAPTSDDADDVLDGEASREIDLIGIAAGTSVADGEPLGGPDEIEKRDAHRWELDPASDEDLEMREDTLTEPPVEQGGQPRPSTGQH